MWLRLWRKIGQWVLIMFIFKTRCCGMSFIQSLINIKINVLLSYLLTTYLFNLLFLIKTYSHDIPVVLSVTLMILGWNNMLITIMCILKLKTFFTEKNTLLNDRKHSIKFSLLTSPCLQTVKMKPNDRQNKVWQKSWPYSVVYTGVVGIATRKETHSGQFLLIIYFSFKYEQSFEAIIVLKYRFWVYNKTPRIRSASFNHKNP